VKAYRYLIIIGILVIASSIALKVTAQEPPTTDPLGEPPTFLAGIWEAWSASPHADVTAEAFHRWDEDGEVEVDCAKCHSTGGYQDFLGADGSAAGVVDAPAPIGSVINCDACHNQVASSLTSVTFPSGVELTDLNDAARCMVCHQGRASSVSVNATLEEAGALEDVNAPNENLRFINIHYYAAAASLYGSEVQGGYQFDGMTYQSRFRHVEGVDTCIDCHSPHTLEVQVTTCVTCHENVESVEDVADVRMPGSAIDYDGDGDLEEGIKGEIETLQEILYAAIQQYAADVMGAPLVYDEARYPYFFGDANANGAIDEGEEAYAAWSARLVQATYNFQVTKKDPGGYVHNAKYHIELLVDSINVLNTELGGTIDTAQLNRDDPGHFNTTRLAFRDWDADGEVPATCAKCHTAEGLPFFIQNGGVSIAQEPSDSLSCSTCHSSIGEEFTVYTLNEVTFPSGSKVTFGEEDPNNICLNCHQGRESTTTVNALIAGAAVGDDETSEALRFRNPHYFAAGATKFGSQAQGGYQYDGKEYTGLFEHNRRFSTCTDCHDTHTAELRLEECMDCHEEVETKDDLYLIRVDEDFDPVDYDGDASVEEPIRDEITTLHDALFAQILSYAADTVGTPIVYSADAYPYWYIDLNANGTADEDEINRDNAYAQWTPNLVRGIYNYLFVAKDPGAFAHNADYSLQLLYDSLESLGGDVSTFTRAPVQAAE
jgi:catechol 2,3-dioxygenase-like lactoylglutathione lyase family enzyme